MEGEEKGRREEQVKERRKEGEEKGGIGERRERRKEGEEKRWRGERTGKAKHRGDRHLWRQKRMERSGPAPPRLTANCPLARGE